MSSVWSADRSSAGEKLLEFRKCGGQLQVLYDCEEASERPDRKELEARHLRLWEYVEFLPVIEKKNIISSSDGGTHL